MFRLTVTLDRASHAEITNGCEEWKINQNNFWEKLRNKRKGFQDKCDEKEGDVHGAGLFYMLNAAVVLSYLFSKNE